MLSTRTLTSECANLEGKKSLHYSDGTLYNYVDGSEYTVAPAIWDWKTLPGPSFNQYLVHRQLLHYK